jgi:NADPH-dependent 2,4-dienoyl-CoA reductase/sulfur reductase-like enzyme
VTCIVVVGAGLGGLRAAEAVRSSGFTGEVVVYGAEPHLPYTRPPLSKDALRDGATPEALAFRRRRSVDDVDWRLGSAVASSDLAARTVTLDDGTSVGWDGLVVATGLHSRRLTLHGASTGRHAVRTLEDAAALRADLVPGARLVVVGAGFIGCEVAATATSMGCSVDVVAPEAVPMERPLGLEVGAALQRRHEERGVRFHLGRLPAMVEPRHGEPDRVGSIVLDDDGVIAADVLVEAVGCIPNTGWLDGNDLDLSDGVLCDGWMRVEGSPQVVAVGDVARFPNALYDDVARRVEHWSIPTDTAKRAGPALVAGLEGRDPDATAFTPMPAFWSDQYDLRVQSFGAPGLGEEVVVLEGDLDGEFAAGYRRRGLLVGVVGIGCMPTLLRLRAEMAAQPTTTGPA